MLAGNVRLRSACHAQNVVSGHRCVLWKRPTAPRLRIAQRHQVAVRSDSGFTGPAYNKYRTRQDIERSYFKEFKEMTVTAEKQGHHDMTVITLLAFLPSWFRFYVIPAPLRYLLHLVSQRVGRVVYHWRKKAVIKGAELDAVLMRHGGAFDPLLMRKMALERLHGKRNVLDVRVRIAWLLGRNQQQQQQRHDMS